MTVKEKFEAYADKANYNLGKDGNLSEVMALGIELAISMGKEEVAMNCVRDLPPSEAFVHPDPRIDGLKLICETMVEDQELVTERKMVA